MMVRPAPCWRRCCDEELQAGIVDLAAARPGVSTRELVRRLPAGADRVRRVLDRLESLGVVATARLRGARRLYPIGLDDEHARVQAIVLLDRDLVRLYDLVRSRPRSLDAVLQETDSWGWERRTAHHRLGVLEDVGLIWRGNDARYPPLHAKRFHHALRHTRGSPEATVGFGPI